MHVAATYDTNPCEWKRSEFETPLLPGPELALDWLCKDNKKLEPINIAPIGPLRYGGDQEIFCLVSAWSDSRQWYFILAVFSLECLSDKHLERLLEEHLPNEIDDED